ncbi:MAG: radical SAM protein [Gammaproteobacteria bacterium]|nr:radical SAM protein [Gammaproteobacteria bacterium]MBU1724853.1 radical SAM protein [Gammaproteobacteria bacterium]MBU2005037.1 radical SAM protein [Gammaproteobacteria bacterium]
MPNDRFNFVRKLYQYSIWPSVDNYIRTKACDFPVVVDLDITTFCDLKCPECISRPVLNTTSFDEKKLFSLVDDIIKMGVKAVVLIGGGEPLLHKKASDVISILGDAGVKIGLVTNGTLLHKHMNAVSKYVSWTRVSVDAGKEETYNLFRPTKKTTSGFYSVINNMKALALTKTGDLGYSFLLMSRKNGESNYSEVEDAVILAKKIGCDYFELKGMFDENHNIIKCADSSLMGVDDMLVNLEKYQDDNFKVFSSFSCNEMFCRKPAQEKNYFICPTAELRCTITPHGVYPCAYHRNDESMKIGDVRENSFKYIWNNKKKKVNPSKDCLFECARHQLNKEIFKIGNLYAQGEKNHNQVEDYDLFV